MKNFKNFYAKVDKIAKEKATKSTKETSKGLLNRSTESAKKPEAGSEDVFNKVATYIAAIRKQKEELMNARS
jgi:hypothetical protein